MKETTEFRKDGVSTPIGRKFTRTSLLTEHPVTSVASSGNPPQLVKEGGSKMEAISTPQIEGMRTMDVADVDQTELRKFTPEWGYHPLLEEEGPTPVPVG
ncbi:hypothetical protein ACWF0M_12750 [Kribbella sp. NPDC055110]